MAEASGGIAEPITVQGNSTKTPAGKAAHTLQGAAEVHNLPLGTTNPPVSNIPSNNANDVLSAAPDFLVPDGLPGPCPEETGTGRVLEARVGFDGAIRTNPGKAGCSNRTQAHTTGRTTIYPSQTQPGPVPGGKHPWHMRRTAYIDYDINSDTTSMPKGRVYVERLRPQHLMYPTPIVLIQGDHHSSDVWLTKPDGRQGWASAYLLLGYEVALLDLPPHGRSTGYGMYDYVCQDLNYIETELTASAACASLSWSSAFSHDKWPGTGQRGDPVFANYCTALNTAISSPAVQQTLSQAAIVSVIRWLNVRATILIGEGSGATAAWLAADRVPGLVAAIIAVEPDGPPFGIQGSSQLGSRQYGIADIPLSFEPPLPASTFHSGFGGCNPGANSCFPFKLVHKAGATGRGESYLQAEGSQDTRSDDPFEETGPISIRKLINLARFPHAIVTAEASRHSTFDWATVDFLRQAGVNAQWLELAKYGIRGNGHLCFLETNSNVIAKFLSLWIQRHIPCARAPSQGHGGTVILTRGKWPGSNTGSLDSNAAVTGAVDSATKASTSATGSTIGVPARTHTEEPFQTPSVRELNWKYRDSISRSITARHNGQTAPMGQPMSNIDNFAAQPATLSGPGSFLGWPNDLSFTNSPAGHETSVPALNGPYFQPCTGNIPSGTSQSNHANPGPVQLGQMQLSQMFNYASVPATGGMSLPLSTNGPPASNLAKFYPYWQPTMFHGYDSMPAYVPATVSDQVFLFCNPELALPMQMDNGQYAAQHNGRDDLFNTGLDVQLGASLPGMGLHVSGFEAGLRMGREQPAPSGHIGPKSALTLRGTESCVSAQPGGQKPADAPLQQFPSSDPDVACGRQVPLSKKGSHGICAEMRSPDIQDTPMSVGQRQVPRSPTVQSDKCQGKRPGANSGGRGRGAAEGTAGCAKRKRDDSTAPL